MPAYLKTQPPNTTNMLSIKQSSNLKMTFQI